MTHLEAVQTDADCPLFSLSTEERLVVDIEYSWGYTPRQEAMEQIEAERDARDVIMDLGYEYRLDSKVAVALVRCAIKQVTGQCPFSQRSSE